MYMLSPDAKSIHTIGHVPGHIPGIPSCIPYAVPVGVASSSTHHHQSPQNTQYEYLLTTEYWCQYGTVSKKAKSPPSRCTRGSSYD